MRKACLAEGAHKKSRSKQSEGTSSKEADPARRTAELHKHTAHKVHAVPCYLDATCQFQQNDNALASFFKKKLASFFKISPRTTLPFLEHTSIAVIVTLSTGEIQ